LKEKDNTIILTQPLYNLQIYLDLIDTGNVSLWISKQANARTGNTTVAEAIFI